MLATDTLVCYPVQQHNGEEWMRSTRLQRLFWLGLVLLALILLFMLLFRQRIRTASVTCRPGSRHAALA